MGDTNGMTHCEGINSEKGWKILFAESNEYQLAVNEFFEKLLHDAYDESEKLLGNILPLKVAQQLKKPAEPIRNMSNLPRGCLRILSGSPRFLQPCPPVI